MVVWAGGSETPVPVGGGGELPVHSGAAPPEPLLLATLVLDTVVMLAPVELTDEAPPPLLELPTPEDALGEPPPLPAQLQTLYALPSARQVWVLWVPSGQPQETT